MLKSVAVNNFRCFENLSAKSLGTVNLISGKNSVGKTSLLEAIFLLMGAPNASLVMALSAFRGIGQSAQGDLKALRQIFLQPLFLNFNQEASLRIKGHRDDGDEIGLTVQVVSEDIAQLPLEALSSEKVSRSSETPRVYSLRLAYHFGSIRGAATLSLTPKGVTVEPLPEHPPLPAVFLTAGHRDSPQEDAERFGRLEVQKRPINLVEILQFIEPRLTRLTTVGVGGQPVLHGDVGLDNLLPLALMGDGVRRLASIILTVATTEGGVVLVDEIENGLHHSVLDHVWEAIRDSCRAARAQIFATTHSFECIRSAYRVFGSAPEFRLHRLERVDGRIEAKTYDAEALSGAMKAELEVR